MMYSGAEISSGIGGFGDRFLQFPDSRQIGNCLYVGHKRFCGAGQEELQSILELWVMDLAVRIEEPSAICTAADRRNN